MKKVLITIRRAEETETLCFPGEYGEKDGRHFLFYQGEKGPARILISRERAEIRRNGESLRELILIPGEETEALVFHDFGSLSFTARGEEITWERDGEIFRIGLSYSLIPGEGEALRNRVLIEARPDPGSSLAET